MLGIKMEGQGIREKIQSHLRVHGKSSGELFKANFNLRPLEIPEIPVLTTLSRQPSQCFGKVTHPEALWVLFSRYEFCMWVGNLRASLDE